MDSVLQNGEQVGNGVPAKEGEEEALPLTPPSDGLAAHFSSPGAVLVSSRVTAIHAQKHSVGLMANSPQRLSQKGLGEREHVRFVQIHDYDHLKTEITSRCHFPFSWHKSCEMHVNGKLESNWLWKG